MFASLLASMHVIFAVTSIQSTICQPLSAPVLASPIDQSTFAFQAPIVFTGTAPVNSTVKLNEQSTTLGTVTSDQNGEFSIQLVLSSGVHTIDVVAVGLCEVKSGNSTTVIVTEPDPSQTPNDTEQPPLVGAPSLGETPSDGQVDEKSRSKDNSKHTKKRPVPSTNDGLSLVIDSPLNNTNTSDASTYVAGRTNEKVTIQITMKHKVVATSRIPSTSFGLSVPLELGKNTIDITATSDNHRQVTNTITVTRMSPNEAVPWYQTTPGKIVIIGSITMLLLLIVVLLLL